MPPWLLPLLPLGPCVILLPFKAISPQTARRTRAERAADYAVRDADRAADRAERDAERAVDRAERDAVRAAECEAAAQERIMADVIAENRHQVILRQASRHFENSNK